MKYNLSKLEKELLSYKLDDHQKKVLKEITKFFEYPLSFDCCLTGKAGTGKTQLAKILVRIFQDNKIPFLVVAPTNKSKNVIASVTDSEAITIHTLLSLYPNLSILDLDMNDLKFTEKGSIVLERNAIWIIDECSMINDTIYGLLIKKAKEYNCKILFLGDISQLAPVKQLTKSKTFDASLVLELTTVYRQQYTKNGNLSELAKVLETLRKSSINRFKEIYDVDSSSLYTYSNPSTFIQNNISLFQDSINLEDPSIVKLIAYTNNRVAAFNQVIRGLIFNRTKELFQVGDIVTGYDTCELTSKNNVQFQFENSVDYIVTECNQDIRTVCNVTLCGWRITLYNTISGEYLSDVFVLDSKLNRVNVIPLLCNNLEKTRLKAIEQKSNKTWLYYFNEISKFLTFDNLKIQNRVIKKKSIDYGYCITVHKSQASQYDTILVDMENILLCPRQNELRQLQYVALSRTQGDIHLYQK